LAVDAASEPGLEPVDQASVTARSAGALAGAQALVRGPGVVPGKAGGSRSGARALAARIGIKEARVALARKSAVLLHYLGSHEEDFRWAQA
jgi:hypothetical protein